LSNWNQLIQQNQGCFIGDLIFAETPASLEQLTLNQRVQGSSPCAPTNNINDIRDDVTVSRARNQFLSDPASDLSRRLRAVRKAYMPSAAIGAFRRTSEYATGRHLRARMGSNVSRKPTAPRWPA
jgi:hypothetical protein